MPKHRKPDPTRRPAADPPPTLEQMLAWRDACQLASEVAVSRETRALRDLFAAFERLKKRRKEGRSAQGKPALAVEGLRSWRLRARVRPQVPSAAQGDEGSEK